MKQLNLLKKEEDLFSLIPVKLEDMPMFNKRIYQRIVGDVLYNHCFQYFYSYFQGVKSCYYVQNGYNLLAIGKKNKTKPKFFIHSPICDYSYLLEVYKYLQSQSEFPVRVIDLNETQMKEIVAHEEGRWKVIKAGKDVIFDLTKCYEMKGKPYRGIRNGCNKFIRQYPNHVIKEMNCKEVAEDAVKVMEAWKDTQGKKYFRVTLGRDIQLFRLFYPVVDNKETFGIVVYDDGKPIGASIACKSANNSEFGMEVTTKVLIEYDGLTDYVSKIMFKKMLDAGIKFSNEAGIYSPGIRVNKEKWHPIAHYPMYELEYIM